MLKFLLRISIVLLLAGCVPHRLVNEIRATATHTLHVGDTIALLNDASVDSLSRDSKAPYIGLTSSYKDPSKRPDFHSGERFLVVRIDTWSGFATFEMTITMKALNSGRYVRVDQYEYDFLFECSKC